MNMELTDHMDSSQGNTVPTGKTDPERKAKKLLLSVPTAFAETDCRRKKGLAQILEHLSRRSDSARSPK